MPDLVTSDLPARVVATIAAELAERLYDRGPGHCVRVDSIHSDDGPALTEELRKALPSGAADVHVLVDAKKVAGDFTIPAERAVELRNRKERLLVLLVPVGTGSAASSLDNSFEQLDIATLLREAGEALLQEIDDEELRAGLARVGRELGRSRPVEAWARFVAAVLENPDWSTLGAELWRVGLIPDLGGDELLDRLARNVRCVKAISRPMRAVAPVADRLATAGLQEGAERDRITRFLSQPDIDLSDATGWTAALVASSQAPTFETWPLAEQRTVDIEQVRVDTFLKEDGTLRPGTQLRQGVAGSPPYAETGPDRPATVKVTWKTEPRRTDGIDRWLLEVLPPADLRDRDTEPFAQQSVKGDKRQATLRMELTEEDLAQGALLAVRVTALDDAGQAVRCVDGQDAVDESQEFAVHWEDEPVVAPGRRTSTPSLAVARLDAALDGQDDLRCEAPSWDAGGATFSVRLGGRRTALLALSPALVGLQRQILEDPGRAGAWEATARVGEELRTSELVPVAAAVLPPALADRRRRLFAGFAGRSPRDVVETLDWDHRLREEVSGYCQSYRRALDAAADEQSRLALLTLDTLMLAVDTAGHDPIAAVLALPLHPLRLAWFAGYDEALGQWTTALTSSGLAKADRRRSVDGGLVRRVTPANLPFAVLGVDGRPYVYTREASLGTGIYLNPNEIEPAAAVQAVFGVLGLGRQDVATDLPPRVLAERIDAYRRVHPGHDSLRLLAFNPGSGELLADAVAGSVLAGPVDEDEVAAAPARIELVGYCRRRSLTDPLPALTDLQAAWAARQVQGSRSYLTPPLGISVRPEDGLAAESSAAHLGIVADLARVSIGPRVDDLEMTASFRNLLTPAANQRITDSSGPVSWRTSPALRARGRGGAADGVEAHRAYSTALATALGFEGEDVSLLATLGEAELAALRAAHERSDWVLTLDRHLGIDLFTESADNGASGSPYILDYAPDFLEGLGPRLTVTTAHRKEVHRLLADAMTELDLATVGDSVRDVLGHLQVVSGRLALRLVGRSTLATEAVSLAALIAYLRRRGALADTIVVPVDAHQDVFGDVGGESGVRRCDVVLVRATARTLRMECVEVKSRRAAALPDALVDGIVDQLEDTVAMLKDTFFQTDPPRIDAELQRARLVGILRHHANRAHTMGLLGDDRRADVERLLERLEEGTLIPEISTSGYVVSLGGAAGLPREHRGVRITALTAHELGPVGLSSIRPPEPPAPGGRSDHPASGGPGTDPDPDPRPRPSPPAAHVSADEVSKVAVAPTPVPAPVPKPPLNSSPSTTDNRSAEASGNDVESPGYASTDGAPVAAPISVEVTLGQDAHASDVRWRISTAGSPHMFVLGIPGQGKSVTTRRILNAFATQRLPALVLDFHGDMAAAPAGGATVLDASDGLELSPFELRDGDHTRYAEAAWELSEVIGYVCDLGEIQQNVVYEAVRDLYRQHGFGSDGGPADRPTMTALAEAVAERERGGRGRNVAARLRPLTDFGLFVDGRGGRSFADVLRSGAVVDVHGLMEQVQVAAGAFVLRKVYREMFQWGQTSELRLAVVLDEAHRFARDVTLPKIMKEGRKYGVAVVVASQRVDDFHRDVLSNAGTKVAFRCNFPQSRRVAGFLRGRAGQDMSTALENLAVGQAYISTPEHSEARKVFMARE